MKTRTTLVLAILAAAAVAGIWLFERELPGTDERRELAELLLPGLEPDAVDRIVVERPDRDTIALARVGAGWRLELPVADRADALAVDRLLDALAESRIAATVPAGEVVGGDSATGLAEGALGVRLAAGDAERTLLIGGRDAPGSLRYARIDNGERLSLVRSALVEALPAGADALRDRSIVHLATADIGRLTIERDGVTWLELSREEAAGGAWWIAHPFEDEADRAAASGLLGRVTGLRAETLLDAEDGVDAADALDPPRVTLTLARTAADDTTGGPDDATEPLVVRIGRAVPGTALRFADASDRPPLFEVDASSLLAELERPVASWRSTVALDAPTWDAERVEMRRGDRSIMVERVEGEFDLEAKWRVLAPEGASFDALRFDAAIGTLSRLDALRIADDVGAAEAGLDAPVATLVVSYADRPDVRLDVGGPAGEGEVYARRAGRPVTLVIDAADAARIDPSEVEQDVPSPSAADAEGDGSP